MHDTIYQSFSAIAAEHRKQIALRRRLYGLWRGITYETLLRNVDTLAERLCDLGIGHGDRIGIFSYNRPEWVIADLAALKIGAVVVPIAFNLTPLYLRQIVEDAGIKLLFVENARLLDMVDSIRDRSGLLQHRILFEPHERLHESIEFSSLIEDETKVTDHYQCVISEDDPATIVYTSGTTGEPRGVILTHRNILSNVRSCIGLYHVSPADSVLSYLPLSHMFERTCGYYALLMAGGAICYADSPQTAAETLVQVRPTILLAVPRAIEKAYGTALHNIQQGSPVKKWLVNTAVACLNEYVNRRYRGERIALWLRCKRWLFDSFVGRQFRKIAGGRLRLLVSGGAPLDRTMAKLLHVLGFNVIEGYGTTETAPVICSNSIEDNCLGTVGKPFDDVEVIIGDHEEILVRGPNVMAGYYNRPAETERVFDAQGWFHTGDQGHFDRCGNLVITGRIKELIITSYGKKIAPFALESRIIRSGYVDQIMVYGDQRKYLVALIVAERSNLERYATENGLSPASYASLVESEEVRRLYRRIIDEATFDLPSYEQVRQFVLLTEGFTVENGLLTSTLKLRRSAVAERYAPLIRRLYDGDVMPFRVPQECN